MTSEDAQQGGQLEGQLCSTISKFPINLIKSDLEKYFSKLGLPEQIDKYRSLTDRIYSYRMNIPDNLREEFENLPISFPHWIFQFASKFTEKSDFRNLANMLSKYCMSLNDHSLIFYSGAIFETHSHSIAVPDDKYLLQVACSSRLRDTYISSDRVLVNLSLLNNARNTKNFAETLDQFLFIQ